MVSTGNKTVRRVRVEFPLAKRNPITANDNLALAA